MNKKTIALCAVCLATHAVAGSVGEPLDSAFTYQGELIVDGAPANGVFDFSIGLTEDAVAGPAISVVLLQDVVVSDGLLNLELDYGSGFTGTAYWLEIAVRAGDSIGAFTTLSPRQRVAATPYALHALSTQSGDAFWYPVGGGIEYDQDVNIGDSPLSLNAALHVESSAGKNPIEVTVDGVRRLHVHDSGGLSVGTQSSPPASGLRVGGTALQAANAHGFVKAAARINCGPGLDSNAVAFFNLVNGLNFSSSSAGFAGFCNVSVGLNMDFTYFTVSAQPVSGVSAGDAVGASCSIVDSQTLACQAFHLGSGNPANAQLQLVFY